jgi:aromatic ring-cleaving dioxygenase
MSELQPAQTSLIQSYHAHIYFRTAAERERALALRGSIGDRYSVQLGRVHDVAIGPHSVPMYQVAFEREVFAELLPWLMLNHGELSVLVHPNTGRDRSDHLIHGLWLGDKLPIHAEVLSDPA